MVRLLPITVSSPGVGLQQFSREELLINIADIWWKVSDCKGPFVGCSSREMSFSMSSILAPNVGMNPIPVPRTTPNSNSVLGPSQWTWTIYQPSSQSLPFFSCRTITHLYTDFRTFIKCMMCRLFTQQVTILKMKGTEVPNAWCTSACNCICVLTRIDPCLVNNSIMMLAL